MWLFPHLVPKLFNSLLYTRGPKLFNTLLYTIPLSAAGLTALGGKVKVFQWFLFGLQILLVSLVVNPGETCTSFLILKLEGLM